MIITEEEFDIVIRGINQHQKLFVRKVRELTEALETSRELNDNLKKDMDVAIKLIKSLEKRIYKNETK